MRLHAQRLVASCAVACTTLLFGGGGGLEIQHVQAKPTAVAASGQLTRHVPVQLGPGRGNGLRTLAGARTRKPQAVRRSPSAPPRYRRSRTTRAKLAPVISAAEKQLFGLTHTWAASSPHSDFPTPLSTHLPVVRSSGLPMAFGISAKKTLPDLHEAQLDESVLNGLSLPNLSVRLDQRALRYLRFYRDTPRGRRAARTLARKASHYTPLIVAALEKANLPTDLVWVSLIESGHNPAIRSPAGAAGLWQFMPDSARAHGLKVNRWVDERLDPERSTQAAILYFTELKRRFGTWELAMAAYNMGHHGLSRAIRKYNTNDFWRLSRLEAALPWETTLYVPKVLAVATVMRNRQAFGLSGNERDRKLSVDTVRVPPGVSFAKLARSAGVSAAELQDLNPQFLTLGTPPTAATALRSNWTVRVPAASSKKVALWLETQPTRVPGQTLKVRRGDTIATIAHRTRTTKSALLALNGLRSGARLSAGSSLLRPEPAPDSPGGLREDQEDQVLISQPRFRYRDRQRVFYRITPGDHLQQVAEAFALSPSDLRLWNDLEPRATLQSGMVLQLFVPNDADFPNVRFAREHNSGKKLSVGSPGFFSHFESERGRSRLQIQSRAGDTLNSIGKRYGLSGGMMARINHRSQRKRLTPGSPVVVYAKYGPIPQEILLSQALSLPPANPPHPASLPGPPAAN